jgi:hypothetical protein
VASQVFIWSMPEKPKRNSGRNAGWWTRAYTPIDTATAAPNSRLAAAAVRARVAATLFATVPSPSVAASRRNYSRGATLRVAPSIGSGNGQTTRTARDVRSVSRLRK